MNKTKKEWFELDKRTLKCAMQFVQDAGYEACYPDSSGRKGDELVYEFHFSVRKGPHVTRKTPVEHLTVRVRVSGPAHKTLRPSFVTRPPDIAGS